MKNPMIKTLQAPSALVYSVDSDINSLSSGVAEMGASGTVTKEISQKIVLLPIAPKFGTQEVNRFRRRS